MIKFLILLLISSSQQRCLEGCLRCSEDNKCLYCDVLNGYQLRSERCIKPQIPNCVLTDENFHCKICAQEFYLNRALNVCSELIPEIKVPNCETHLGPKICELCQQNFYLKNGACKQIDSPIPNCRIENERKICLECEASFIRSVDKKSCISRPNIPNCGTHKWTSCRKCQPGYLSNQNYYFDLLFNFKKQKDNKLLNRQRKSLITRTAEGFKFPVCQKVGIENCLVFETFDRCRKCNQGYFVNQNRICQLNPVETIRQCLKYSSNTNCISCAQGYHLKDKKCTKVYNIENCVTYQQDAHTTVCTRCFDDYYLSAENLCSRRTDLSVIPLCVRLSYKFEKCEQCLTDYITTSDGFRCLAIIQNCQRYEQSNKNDTFLRCALCSSGFYYNQENRICIKGSIDQCAKYATTEDRCMECGPKSYLVDNKCEPQTPIQFCQNYHKTTPNQCADCDQNSFLFAQAQSCQRVDRIPRCEVYASKTACAKCKDGYFLKNSSECTQIGLRENCLQKNGNNCVKCLPHFALLLGKCTKGYDWATRGCNSSNMNGTTALSDIACSSCRKNHVPINIMNTFQCHEVHTLHREFNINKDQSFDADCLQYMFETSGVYRCVKCAKGRVLVDGVCRENCYQSGKLTVYRQWISLHNKTGDALNDSIRVDYTNICEKTIPNCELASLDIEQDFVNVRYSCEKCMKGFIPVINLPNFGNVVSNSVREKQLGVHMPLTQGPGVMCVDPSQEKVLGDVNPRNQVEFCKFYVRISKNSFGCRTCAHGKTGKVIQAIKRCKVFKNPHSCFECDQGFFLQNENECRPIERVENCQTYDPKHNDTKCITCTELFYLSNSSCLPRVVSVGKENCNLKVDADTCLCKDRYVMHPNTQVCHKKPDHCLNAAVVAEVVQCTTCDRKFAYLEGNSCLIGTVAFCEEFDLNQNNCTKCLNGYFLINNQCKAHTSNLDSQCNLWSQGSKDVCDTCKSESTKFKKINHCKSVLEVIPNCKVYFDIFSCKECDDTYYLNNVSKRCLKIPPSSHCLKLRVFDLQNSLVFDKSDYTEKTRYIHTCDKCETNYYRRQYQINEKFLENATQNTQDYTLFKCVDWLSYHTKNCTETQIKGDENFGNFCFGCNAGFLPLKSDQSYICVNNDYIGQRKHGFARDKNCRAYEYTSNRDMKCVSCRNNFYLNSNTNICIAEGSSCPANHFPYAFYISESNEFERWVCRETGLTQIDNCISYVTSFTKATSTSDLIKSHTCFKCSSEKYPILDIQTAPARHTTPINVIDQVLDIKHFDQEFPAIKCSTTETTSGIIVDNQVKNCALYKINHITNTKLLCVRCKQGYHGRVFTEATDGLGIEACEKMTTCHSDPALSGLHLNSPWMDQKVHPIALFSCQRCLSATQIPVAFMKGPIAQDYYGSGSDIFQMFNTNFKKTGVANIQMNIITGTDLFTKANQPADSFQTQCWEQSKLFNATNPTNADDLIFVDSGFTLPSNCGLVVVDVTLPKNNAFCVACKPGYFIKEFDATNLFAVKTCELIPASTCSTTIIESLNRCSGCVYEYNSVTDTVKSAKANATTPGSNNCLLPKTGNCFAGKMIAGALECHICDPGYELVNNKCLVVEMPNCKTKKSNLLNSFNKNHKLIGERAFQYAWISQQIDLKGCVECNSNSEVLYYNSSADDYLHPAVCSQLNDTFGAVSPANNTAFIDSTPQLKNLSNCKRYGFLNNKYVCVECNPNYRMHTNDYSCSPVTTNMTDLLPNCIISQSHDTTICQKCKVDFVNVGGLCRPAADSNFVDTNCLTTAGGQITNFQSICSKCKPGFYAKLTISPFNKCIPIPTTETNCTDFLDETGCVDCSPGYGLTLIKQLNSDQPKRICTKMDQKTTEKYLHDENCEKLTVISTSDSLNQQRLICRKCLPHSVLTTDFIDFKEQCYSVVSPINQCIEYDSPLPTADILANQLQLMESKDFRCTKCSNIAQFYLDRVLNQCLTRTNISNCENYDIFADRCKMCGQGFELSVDMRKCSNFKNNSNVGYLDVCRDIEGCNATSQLEGLDKTLSSIYSCHQCAKGDQIPFAIGTLKLNEKEQGFEQLININEVKSGFIPWSTTDIEPLSEIQCLKPASTSFLISNNDFVFPANCALGFVNVGPLLNEAQVHNAQHSSGNASFNYDKTTIRCHACKPGYAASRQKFTLNGKEQELKFLITACTLIANCENSTWLNGCSQCMAGFAHAQEKERTKFDTCVAVPEVHKECWAFDQSTARCVYCKKGAYLNEDRVCELISTPNCEHREFRFGEIQTLGSLLHGMYYAPDFVGCNKCQNGFVGVWIPQSRTVCVNSLYHINSSLIANTLFVPNCTEYFLSYRDVIKCKKCSDGFLKSNDERSCFMATSANANCRISASESVCIACVSGFVAVNGICEKEAIVACVKYVDNSKDCPLCLKHEQICIQCAPEKYLEGNQCIDGIIQYCKIQETAKICKQCQDNYTLILSKNHTSYCFPNNPHFNCKTFREDLFQAQNLQCSACADSSFILSNSETDKSLNVCTQFLITQNCLRYDNNPITLGNSSFRCVECKREFYHSGTQCAKRTIMPNECANYDLAKDLCISCQEGYFISVDGKQCTPYPQGILGCESYLTENTCTKCLPKYYEKEEGCEPVITELPNCVYYEDENICQKCEEGFHVLQGRCVAVVAQNCVRVETPYACLSCKQNSHLKTVDGVTSCVETTIANCAKIEREEPYNCLSCDGDFFPNKQECVPIANLIKNCVEYESLTVCKSCASPSILSYDRTTCVKTPESINEVDLNCSESFMSETPVCSTCSPGFVFQHGKCIACNTGLGCFVCDPNNRHQCLMCQTGYIMTPEGECIKALQESSGLDDMGRSLKEMKFDDVVLMRL